PEALARLQQVGARIIRTDEFGSVTLRSRDGQPWQLETERGRPESGTLGMGPRVDEKTLGPALATPGPTATMAPPAAATSSPAAASPGGFAASSRSAVFHRADCPAVQTIVKTNLLHFQ